MHPITPKACDRIRVILDVSHQLWELGNEIAEPLESFKINPDTQVGQIEKEEKLLVNLIKSTDFQNALGHSPISLGCCMKSLVHVGPYSKPSHPDPEKS